MADYVDFWRIRDPKLIGRFLRKERINCSWAIALVRQCEAHMKAANLIDGEASLSIQDFLMKMWGTIREDGSVDSLEDAPHVFTQRGLVLEDFCPLTFALYQRPNNHQREVEEYRAQTVHDDLGEEFPTVFMDHMVSNALETTGPTAASIMWFPSYFDALSENNRVILQPTDDEWLQYEADPTAPNILILTMLLIGHGRENDVFYWEFQHSIGEEIGDGIVRVAREDIPSAVPNMIIEFVTFEV